MPRPHGKEKTLRAGLGSSRSAGVAALLLAALPLAGLRAASQEGPAEAPRYRTIPFPDGDPATLAWDEEKAPLYVADNENNHLWEWTEAGGLRVLATTPDPRGAKEAHATFVGQVVRLANGTLVVPRFGKPGGGYGGIVFVNGPSGESGVVPNLDPQRRRLGLTVAPDGTLYGSYFGDGASGA